MLVAQTVVSDVSAVPYDDRSLLVRWKSLVSRDLTDFVVEWTPLLKKDPSLTQFEISNRNQTSLVITGMCYSISTVGFQLHVLLVLLSFCLVFLIQRSSLNHKNWLLGKVFFFLGATCLYTLLGAYGRWYTLTSSLSSTGSFEPYKPYGISVYPRFKDGIGLPQTVNAYSRQKGKSPKTQRGSHKEEAEMWESGRLNFEEEGKEFATWEKDQKQLIHDEIMPSCG